MVAMRRVDGGLVLRDVEAHLSPFAELGSWEQHWYQMMDTAWVCASVLQGCIRTVNDVPWSCELQVGYC